MRTSDREMNLIELFLFIPMLVLMVVLVVSIPFVLNAQAKCLEQGYPKAEITWNLKTYCTTLDGAVTVKVEEQ